MSHLKCIVQMVKLLVWVIDSLVTGLHWRRLASCVNPGNSFLLRCNFSICLFMTSNFRCQTVEDAVFQLNCSVREKTQAGSIHSHTEGRERYCKA